MKDDNSFKKHTLDEYFAEARKEKSTMTANTLAGLVQLPAKQEKPGLRYTLPAGAVLVVSILFFLYPWHKAERRETGSVSRLVQKDMATVRKDIHSTAIPPVTTLTGPAAKNGLPQLQADKYYQADAGVFDGANQGILPISLSGNELSRLGIAVSDRKICISRLNLCLDKEGVVFAGAAKADSFPQPVLITDDEGNSLQQERDKKDSVAEGRLTDFLVPVLVCGHNSYCTIDKASHCFKPDILCWYLPDDTFLERLPPRYRQSIRRDYEQLRGKQADNNSCEYFEVCKNTLAPYEDVSVYPNPVRNEIHLRLKVAAEKQVQISLFDINGKRNMILDRNISLAAGNNTLDYNVDCLAPGMYLMEIVSTSGELSYQRIIKQ